MRHLEYDKKLSLTIKAFRELRQIKQSEIAKAINVTQTTYSKIEFGQIAITPGQLKLISAALGTSNFQILAIVEAEVVFQENFIPLSELLLNFVKMLAGIDIEYSLTDQELEIILNKIKTRHALLLKKK
ncbi:MAG: helix-turn-helix domain-containing protein [Bacteroidia bacterium]